MKPAHVFLSVLLLPALSAVVAMAQGPGPGGVGPGGPGPHAMTAPGPGIGLGLHHGPWGAWWKNSDVVKELQLTDAQIKQIEQTFTDYRLKLIDLRADMERQETKLQPLLEADQPNEQQVSSQLDAVLAARARLEKANALMMLAIRHVLTVDQWKKLQTIEHSRHMHGMGRGERFEVPAPPPGEIPD
jgi:Spy/CpxP family protein refolding chaperone